MLRGGYGGYVLAGGQSSRMGSDKALLPLAGQTLLEHAADAVKHATGAAVIVGSREQYGRFGFPVIADRRSGSGPLAGIEAALEHTRWDWNLLVACDMPGLTGTGLERLLERAEESDGPDVLLPLLRGRPQPLCAVYHRNALPRIRVALDSGRRKITEAIADLRVVRFEVGDDDLFRNVNTPEEWQAAIAH